MTAGFKTTLSDLFTLFSDFYQFINSIMQQLKDQTLPTSNLTARVIKTVFFFQLLTTSYPCSGEN